MRSTDDGGSSDTETYVPRSRRDTRRRSGLNSRRSSTFPPSCRSAVTKVTINMGVGERRRMRRRSTRRSTRSPHLRTARSGTAGDEVDRELQAARGHAGRRTRDASRARMYEFLDRLASIALPRIRDFRASTQARSTGAATTRSASGSRSAPRGGLRQGSVDPRAGYRDHDIRSRMSRTRAPRRPRFAVRRREKGTVSGQEVARRQAAARFEAQGARVHALQQVRSPARRLPQVRRLPHLPA